MREHKLGLVGVLLTAGAGIVSALVALTMNGIPPWVQWVIGGIAFVCIPAFFWAMYLLLSGLPYFERRRDRTAKRIAKEQRRTSERLAGEAKALGLLEFEADYLPWERFAGEANWLLEEIYALRDKPVEPTAAVAAEWARRIDLARYFARGINVPLRDAARSHLSKVEAALSRGSDASVRDSAEYSFRDWVQSSGRHYGPWMASVGWHRR